MDRELLAAQENGVPVIGICGGYQMLGKTLVDEGFESAAGVYPGLGLLDCTTRFAAYSKNTTQVRRRAEPVPPILSSMGEVTGYEIHMGVTEPGTDREAFCGDGRVNADGLVFGTYMHGLFLNPSAANALLAYLSAKKGLPFTPIPAESADPYDIACVPVRRACRHGSDHNHSERIIRSQCGQSRGRTRRLTVRIGSAVSAICLHPMRLVMLWNPSPCRSAHRTACTAERSTSPVTRHFTQ